MDRNNLVKAFLDSDASYLVVGETMACIKARRVMSARDLRLFLQGIFGDAGERLLDHDVPVFVEGREVCGVELQEGDHPTLGKVRNVVLTLGPRPGHTD